MRARVALATLVFIAVVITYFPVAGALATLRQHVPDPDAIINVGGTHMRHIDAFCQRIVPAAKGAGRLESTLICQHYRRLVPAVFILASITGWCASIWLLALQQKPEVIAERWLAFITSFLLASLSGLIVYVLLLPTRPRLGELENYAALPLLAGIFLRTFFDELSRIFKEWMGRFGPKTIIPFMIVLTTTSADALEYWRCTNPKDKCIALTEQEKKSCPECATWALEFLDWKLVLNIAREKQRAAGLPAQAVASNYFLATVAEELNVPLTGTLATTRTIAAHPERYGLQSASAQNGALVVIGDIAGIAVEQDGELRIAYPSATTGKVNFELPEVLEASEKASAEFFKATPE